MSHELRSPLTAILGYAELLRYPGGDPLTPGQAADVAQIVRSADHLLALIDDVLDLSLIEAGGVALEPEEVDLGRLVGAVLADVALQAAAKGLTVAADVPPGLPVQADPLRLHQVLLNLAGNAVKFTEQGRVTVAARRVEGGFEVAVADTGIGIAPEALPHVFEEFRRADPSTTRRYGGSGLGLAIAKRIVEAHGGMISAESAPGVGSTFTVRLPAAR
jgi:signal transduction histidine kinase